MNLTPDALKQVRELVILGNHYESMLQAIRQSLEKVVEDETGVDLSGGDWHLDIDTGELSHVTTD